MTYRTLIAAALLLAPAALQAETHSATETDALTLEERVQRIEDEAAIRQVILDYAVYLDSRNLDGYVSLFAEDGVWQNGNTIMKGRDEIRGLLTGMFGEQDPDKPYTGTNYRIVSNVEVDLHGDTASARSRQLSIQRGENGAPTPYLSGIYEDEFIREDGEWKILHRKDITVMPSREEWVKQMAERRAAQAEDEE